MRSNEFKCTHASRGVGIVFLKCDSKKLRIGECQLGNGSCATAGTSAIKWVGGTRCDVLGRKFLDVHARVDGQVGFDTFSYNIITFFRTEICNLGRSYKMLFI
jgi:hypothetical protein